MNLSKFSKFCFLLRENAILEELQNIIKNYELIFTVFNKGKYILKFLDSSNNTINLTIDYDSIHLTKICNNCFSNITINNNYLLKKTNLEKREKGIIITETKKLFDYTDKYTKQIVLTDLIEDRYAFSYKKLDPLINCKNCKLLNFEELFSKIKQAKLCFAFLDESELHTNFSIHLDNMVNWANRNYIDKSKTTKIFINGENISELFNIEEGPDKAYRIYDLYHGIINKRNENDIISINLGNISNNAFNYKSFIGITDKEEEIVGKNEDFLSIEYEEYLSNFFNEKFGYNGEIIFEREGLLRAINHKISSADIIKRNIEKKLGIPYCEFELLDLEEQHKLIEKVTGKKIKPDFIMRIDGIPIDDKHILTREKTERKFNEIIDGKPKSFLKQLFRKK